MFFARAHYFPKLTWPFPAPTALALSSFSTALSASFLLSLSRRSPLRSLRPGRVGPNQPLRCSRRSLGARGFGFHLRMGCLLAKSGTLGRRTHLTRKASRMNTCAKRVGGGGRERHGHQELRGANGHRRERHAGAIFSPRRLRRWRGRRNLCSTAPSRRVCTSSRQRRNRAIAGAWETSWRPRVLRTSSGRQW